jgi:hypothetical protein
MFGLTQLEERLAWLAILAFVIVGFGWHERGIGTAKCVAADTKAEAKQDEKDAQTHQKQQDAVISEGTTYAAIIAAPPPVGPPVRLCHDTPHPAPVPATPAARPGSNDPPAIPAASGGDSQKGPDVGPDLRANDRKADAQVSGLQAYVRDVCLAPR